jgi:hypothetical protein
LGAPLYLGSRLPVGRLGGPLADAGAAAANSFLMMMVMAMAMMMMAAVVVVRFVSLSLSGVSLRVFALTRCAGL